MARYRSRGMALRPVNRIKHVIDATGTPNADAQLAFVLADAVDTPTIGVTNSVQTGAKINGFYLRVEVANKTLVTDAIANVYLAVWKNPASNMTAPQIDEIGGSDTKRFFVHQEMLIIENQTAGNPRTLFNGVIVVPKGMRRMGPDDRWEVIVLAPSNPLRICIQCHYKEFR